MAGTRSQYVQVIPLVRLRNDLDFFTYSVPAELRDLIEPGQLVKISFRNKSIQGIVHSFIPSYDGKVKPVDSIIEIKPLLETWQLDLVSYLSKRYLVSMATVTKMLVPTIPKRSRPSVDRFFSSLNQVDSPALRPLVIPEGKDVLVKYRRFETMIEVIRNIINRSKKGEQVSIIVPEYFDLKKIVEHLSAEIQTAVIYHGKMSVGRWWQNWLSVSLGEASLVLGTRRSIFAPFKNLKTIIIVDEEDRSHKQEEPSPRYSVLDVAKTVAGYHGARLVRLSMAPRLSSLHAIANKQMEYLELDSELTLPTVQIIDSTQEARAGNFSPLSIPLQNAVADNLTSGKKVFLHLNRSGFMRALICRDCQQETTDIAAMSCKKCRGSRLKAVGLGIQSIKEIVIKENPGCRVFAFDAGDDFDQETITQYLTANQIIISTDYGLKFLPWKEIGLVGVLTTDLPWFSNEYDATERVFSDLFKLIGSLDSTQEIIIQTRQYDRWVFNCLRQYDLKDYYLREISERKMFNLPPYGILVNLIYKNVNEKEGEAELALLYKKLKIELMSAGLQAGEPRPAHQFLVRANYLWNLPISLRNEVELEKLALLRKYPFLVDIDS